MEDVQLKLDNKDVEEDNYSDISLRPVDLSDVDHFMEWLTDEKVSKFCSWDCYTSKEAAMKFLKDNAISHPCGNEKCRGEIGYVLASKYWGKGIATKAVKLVASTIFFESPHLERLEALVDVENVGSQKVLEKVGFSREGVLRKYCLLNGKSRDMVIFSLLSTDPQVGYSNVYD
ncbi:hypothetical protein ACH5RR_031323 [Cinchona calisaya]|uniref:N-acetyltransferase domain-containing protein n=1 Tax=Cinchona calisaya TaxID=153742 RepID=A0ABD2YEW7_9GENT